MIGIVASRITERFNRPAILLALDPDDPMAPAHGSGRSIPGFDLLGALDATGEHLMTYGGHRAAAGLSVLPHEIDAFREAFERHAESVLTPEMLAPGRARRRGRLGRRSVAWTWLRSCWRWLRSATGNPDVRCTWPARRFDGVRPMGEGGKHARFNVSSGGARASAVAFGCDGRVAGADGGPVDASFKLERNVWNGVVEPRLSSATPRVPPRRDPGRSVSRSTT